MAENDSPTEELLTAQRLPSLLHAAICFAGVFLLISTRSVCVCSQHSCDHFSGVGLGLSASALAGLFVYRYPAHDG